MFAKKRLDNNAQGEYNSNNNVEGDATNGREEASRKIGSQEVVRNDARRTGSDQEIVSRKIKEILRKSSVKRTHTELAQGKSGRVEQAETAEAFEERVRNDDVAADIVKSFSGRELLKSKDITEIVQFLWEGLNDFSDSEIKRVRPIFYC